MTRVGSQRHKKKLYLINATLFEGGGQSKYCIMGNLCLQTFLSAKRGWRYIGVSLHCV